MLLETLVKATPALTKLMGTDLPIVLSFRLGKLVNVVDPILKVYSMARNKLIREIGTKDDKGLYSVPPDRMEEFNEELENLLKEDIAIGEVPQVTLKDLGDIKMNSQDMAALTPWLIKE